jgi:hypothetical protein
MSNLAHTVVAWLAANAIALVALGLSAWALVSQTLSGRSATVSAWFARTPGGAGKADRLVIVNHGPADARDVNLTFVNDQGEIWDLRTNGPNPLPLPVLSPGDQFHLPIHVILGTGEWVRTTVHWTDRRRGVQERRTTLSLTGIPLGDASAHVEIHRLTSELRRRGQPLV